MKKHPEQPDLQMLLSLVTQELDFLEPFDLSDDYELMKFGGALVTIKEYLEKELATE